MADIFLSYAHQDHQQAQQLARALTEQGWSVFWDRTIPTGKTWREYIGDQLEQAKCVLVVWSKSSIKSRWVQEEADAGIERNILIPVFLERVKPPLGFRSIQAADLSSWDGTDTFSAFLQLINDINLLSPQPAAKETQSTTELVEEMGMQELIGRNLKSRYKIVDLLGDGTLGTVFKAHDTLLQRVVAIKVFHPHFARQSNFQERFSQEARVATHLTHPNIVQVYDYGDDNSLLYLVMQYLPGGNLQRLLQDLKTIHQCLILNETVTLVHQIAQAVEYAHQRGVVHRDIKPSNILFEPEASDGLPFRPVLTDFGLAKLLDEQPSTKRGTSMGTLAYMSPELARGEVIDGRSDVYSLGVLLYELSVGAPPFPAKTFREAIRYTKLTPSQPSSLRPGFPENLEKVILKALDKERNKRFASAGELAEALGSLQPVVALTNTFVPRSFRNELSLERYFLQRQSHKTTGGFDH